MRLTSWDDAPAASIYLNPAMACISNVSEIAATGDFSLRKTQHQWYIEHDVDNTRARTWSGEIRVRWNRIAVDVDGEPLDVLIELLSLRTQPTDSTFEPGAKQCAMTIDPSSTNVDCENLSGIMGVPASHSSTWRIRLLRQDGTLARGRFMAAWRDVDIDWPADDDWSESVHLGEGFDPEIYILDDSWLTVDTSRGMVHENSSGVNYDSDPRESVSVMCQPEYTFEWRGTSCGTVLFDSVKTAFDVPVEKRWVLADGHVPSNVTVRLKGSDGSSRQLVLSAANGWRGVFADVPLMTADNAAITYTLTEDAVDGFSTDIVGNVASGFAVTNTWTRGGAGASKRPREAGWL